MLTVLLTSRDGDQLAEIASADTWGELLRQMIKSYALDKARRVRAYAGGLVVQV